MFGLIRKKHPPNEDITNGSTLAEGLKDCILCVVGAQRLSGLTHNKGQEENPGLHFRRSTVRLRLHGSLPFPPPTKKPAPERTTKRTVKLSQSSISHTSRHMLVPAKTHKPRTRAR
ncbi:unnamed protein product [Pleuronectes platessa]|uniref:Uncharacterized protein n=1 Tax=Pleuronectes platessa TaxID=8262 RepID=A0A9N7Y675_PLEPL|nr:unnamed protein product [Pleuronectes platessa]